MKARLRQLAPIVVTLAILALLFWRIPFAQVLESIENAAPWAVPVGLVMLVAIYVADALATWKTFAWCLGDVGLRQMLLVRAASYLLAAVNYTVGQGALVVFLRRSTGVSVARASGAVLLVVGSNLLVLLVLATAGALASPLHVPYLPAVLGGVYVAGLGYAALLVAKPAWMKRIATFEVLLDAGLLTHVKATIVRVPHVIALIGFSFLMMRAFRVEVPLTMALLGMPIVYVVAFLPISFQGIGTAQAVMVLLFSRYAPGDTEHQQATVLASSMVATVLLLLFQAALGVGALQSTTGRQLQKSDTALNETPSPEASL